MNNNKRMKPACLILFLILMVFTACSAKKDISPESDPQTADEAEMNNESIMVKKAEIQENKMKTKIFVPDSQAEKLLEKEVDSEATPQGLINVLVNESVLPNGVRVNDFTMEIDGVEFNPDTMDKKDSDTITGKLDLTQEFADSIRQQGTAGENMMMGAVVNTFIENYELLEIEITVNGQTLESGHSVYDQPLTFYEDNDEGTDKIRK